MFKYIYNFYEIYAYIYVLCFTSVIMITESRYNANEICSINMYISYKTHDILIKNFL